MTVAVSGAWPSLLRLSRIASVSALRVQPSDRFYIFRSKLYAFRIYFKTPVIDLALSSHYIQITARGLGVVDGAVVVLVLFEAAETALVAS